MNKIDKAANRFIRETNHLNNPYQHDKDISDKNNRIKMRRTIRKYRKRSLKSAQEIRRESRSRLRHEKKKI